MAGFMPAIHVYRMLSKGDVDGRDEPGHDGAIAHAAPRPGQVLSPLLPAALLAAALLALRHLLALLARFRQSDGDRLLAALHLAPAAGFELAALVFVHL